MKTIERRGVRRIFNRRTVTAIWVTVGLFTVTASPAGASSHEADLLGGTQEHLGIVGGGATPSTPCSTYHNFLGHFEYRTTTAGITVGTKTFTGIFTAKVEQSATDSFTWNEFSDGSHTDGCLNGDTTTGADNEWVGNFTLRIEGEDSTDRDHIVCSANGNQNDLLGAAGAQYRRVLAVQTFTSSATCSVRSTNGTTSSAAKSITLTTTIACGSPITPPHCMVVPPGQGQFV